MEKIGIVERIQGKKAKVRIQRVSACGESCASCKGGCTPTNQHIIIENMLDAKIGQRVKVDLKTDKVIKAAAVVYIIPLLSTFIGVIAGIILSNRLGYEDQAEGIGIVLGLLFLIFTLLPIRWFDQHVNKHQKNRIVMKSIID